MSDTLPYFGCFLVHCIKSAGTNVDKLSYDTALRNDYIADLVDNDYDALMAASDMVLQSLATVLWPWIPGSSGPWLLQQFVKARDETLADIYGVNLW